MARKKSSPSASRNRKGEIKSNPKSRQLAGDLSPPPPPPPCEYENLKALNQLLIKETMERREQVSQLNSLVKDLSAKHLIQREINTKVSEELERVLAEFEMLKAEKEEGQTRFEGQIKEDKRKLDEFEVMMAEITALKDEIETARAMQEVEIARLQNEAELKQCTISELETVCKDHADTNARLLADIDARRRDLELEREEAEGLRSQVGNLGKIKDGLKEELERLHIDFTHLKKEKEEGESQSEDRMKETSQLLDDLRKKMAGIEAQRDEIERARADQEAKNAELQNEVDKLQCNLWELERVRKAQADANALLQADDEAAREDFDLKREEAEGFRSQVGELEKCKHGLKEEFERLLLDLALLKKEKEEGETRLEDRLKETTQCLVDSKREVVEISAQRDEIDRARADQEYQKAQLQRDVDQLRSTVSELDRVCKDHVEAIALLQVEKDAACRDLVLEKGVAEGLRVQVSELQRSNDNTKEELEGLHRHLYLLKKEKEELEKEKEELESNSESRERVLAQQLHALGAMMVETRERELKKVTSQLEGLCGDHETVRRGLDALRLRVAEMNSEKALLLLKSTAGFMLGSERGFMLGSEREVMVRDLAENGDEMHHFASEPEGIRAAFVSKIGMV